jgi:uncharacterized phiE125 gp8 family phage protein
MRTALICTSDPAAFVTLAEVKAQLHVTDTTDDNMITALLGAACASLEGGDGLLKRAVADQTWQLVLPQFMAHRHDNRLRDLVYGNPARPWNAIQLPLPPTKAVTEIAYYDGANALQTMAGADYNFVDCGTEPAFVIPTTSWPSSYRRPDAVKVTFTAGYGSAKIPTPVKQAVFLMVRQLYDLGARNVFVTGETVFGVGASTYGVSAAAAQICQNAVDRLLFNYRILGR